MVIKTAQFITSSSKFSQLPPAKIPEFAFIGRSNVGKSTLINMVTRHNKLAKTSSTPGKTRTINHFLINEAWYLVDLPGYGFAKVPKRIKAQWEKLIYEYIGKRESLCLVFVLLDIRHAPLAADLNFMKLLGENGIPFHRVFTKADKISVEKNRQAMLLYDKVMLKDWEGLPPSLLTSGKDRRGQEELLKTIEESLAACDSRL